MTAPDEEPPACGHGGLAVAHAWYAAEPEDEQVLLEHLPGCAACRRVVDDALAVATELALAVPTQDPPPGLRERILAAASAEPAPARPVEPPAAPAPLVGVDAEDEDEDEDDGPPTGTRPGGVPRRALSSLVLLAAAVVLGVALLAGQALLPGGAGPDPATTAAPPDPASLAARAAQVVDDAESADPSVRHAVLRDGDGRSVAVVLDGGAGRDGTVRVVDLALANPSPGRSWVLWGTARGDPPAALGALDRVSGRPVGTGAPPPDGGWRGFAVSQEPSGPVPDRPSEVLALGTAV